MIGGMILSIPCIFLLLSLATAATAYASEWSTTLADGSRLSVDTRTNQAWVIDTDGGRRLLRDGVHKLQDGRTLTVRSGLAVPNEDILLLRRMPPPRRPRTGDGGSACVWLEKKVCGNDGACLDSQGCRLARQLRQFEREEREETGLPDTPSGERCTEALDDERLFPHCMNTINPATQ
jgi:hypothetical protein